MDVPPFPLSGPVSQSCSPQFLFFSVSLISVSFSSFHFCLFLSPLCLSRYASVFLTLLSISYFNSPSLPLSLDLSYPCILLVSSTCPCPSCYIRLLGPHLSDLGHVTQSSLSAPPAQLSFWLWGQMVESQAPTSPVLRGPASWSGSATSSCLGRGGAGLLPSEGDQPGENALESLQLLGGVPGASLPPPPYTRLFLWPRKHPPPLFFILCATFLHRAQHGLGEEARFRSFTVQ